MIYIQYYAIVLSWLSHPINIPYYIQLNFIPNFDIRLNEFDTGRYFLISILDCIDSLASTVYDLSTVNPWIVCDLSNIVQTVACRIQHEARTVYSSIHNFMTHPINIRHYAIVFDTF